MNILLCVHHHLDANTGAPGITLQLGAQYEALGHRVSYTSFDDLPARLPGPAAELIFPEAVAWLFRRRAHNVDVVDATTGDSWLWTRLTRRRSRPRLVTRSHGLEHVYWESAMEEAATSGSRVAVRTRLYHGGWRLREVGASLRASDACVFSNHHDLDYAVERLGVARTRAAVVLNGIPEALAGLPLAPVEQEVGVAVIGSWTERKGARYAAAALTAVLGRHRRTRALLLGTKVPREDVLQNFPASVRERVHVVPSYEREALPQLLAGAHVLVSASLAEGFSVAIPEAMAAGLVPVATALPGTREIVRHEHNGLLVPPADAAALEAALALLLDDPGLLARLREAAHADAQLLTWRRIAQQNLQVYGQALAR